MVLYMIETDFLKKKKKKNFVPKMGKMGQKKGYLFYYFLNLILWKNLVPKIWAKMLSASQIAGFLN